MKKTFGAILIGLGILSTLTSSANARDAPNVSYLIGTFLPGLLFLLFGLALRREKSPQPSAHAVGDPQAPSDLAKFGRADQFRTRADFGVGVGLVAMFLGSGVVQQGPDFLLPGTATSLGGWALLLWGCVNYVRWKGYSGWYGLFGYFLLLGLIVLACFPNRRKRLLLKHGSEPVAELEALAKRDRRSGYRFLLAVAPLGVLFVGLGGMLHSSRANINPAEWQAVAPAGLGFQALMPGTPRQDQQNQETPAGTLELHKFRAEPKGKKELFMVVVIRFPPGMTDQLGGAEWLLELGRQDVLTACQGRLQSERRIALNGCPGLELEVLPAKGAIVKARIYAAKNQVYQVSVHVPKVRFTSDDVQMFFDSFQLSAEPPAATDRSGVK
jgi:hypothetical protein